VRSSRIKERKIVFAKISFWTYWVVADPWLGTVPEGKDSRMDREGWARKISRSLGDKKCALAKARRLE